MSNKEDLMKAFGEAEMRPGFKSPVKPLITQIDSHFHDNMDPVSPDEKAEEPSEGAEKHSEPSAEAAPSVHDRKTQPHKKKRKLSQVLYNVFSDRTFCKMLNAFLFCMAVNTFEYFYLINKCNIPTRGAIGKVFGIIVVFIFMYSARLKPAHLGIPQDTRLILSGIRRALIFSVAIIPAYLVDIIFVLIKGGSPGLSIFAYNQVKATVGTTDWIANILILILINALSAFMLEVLFRGIIYRMGKSKFGFGQTTFIVSLFYSLWYLMIPLSKIVYYPPSMVLPLCAFYLIFEFFLSMKWCLCARASGSVWLPIFDHFIFTTSTALIRVVDTAKVSSNYIDANKYIRYIVFQIVSFILCYLYYKKKMLLRKKMKSASVSRPHVVFDSFADLTPADVLLMKSQKDTDSPLDESAQKHPSDDKQQS